MENKEKKYQVIDAQGEYELTKEEIAQKYGWTKSTLTAYISRRGNGDGIIIIPPLSKRAQEEMDYIDNFDKEWRAMLKLFGKG